MRLAGLTLALFTALAVAHTWPLASAPASLSRNDHADAMLNEWIVAWIAHQLPRAPLRLFDANIFHPEPNTLAFSEHLLVPGLMAAPALWLGASPVLAYNLLILAGFALTGWSVWFVMWRWTGDPIAAIAAGTLAAFNAHMLIRIPHVQALHLEFLPLALFALDRLIQRPAIATALWVALWFSLQALTSNYALVFTLIALMVATIVRAGEWRSHARAFVVAIGVAAIVSAIVIGPFLIPYLRAQRQQGLTRSLDEVAAYSAGWRDYLATEGRLHARWSERFTTDTTALFPGVVAIALAIAGLATLKGRTTHGGGAYVGARVRMLAAIAVVAFALSFGPALPGYALLYRVLPLLQGIRGAARFGQLALFALALIAGFGAAAIRARLPGRAGTSIVAIAILAAHAEALRAPLELTRDRGVPAVYDNLARDPSAIVAEFPFPAPDAFQINARYQLHSTAHWRPLVNGYSGFAPASYAEHYKALRVLPEPEAIAMLRRLGVTHVVIHEAAFEDLKGREVYEAVVRSGALETIAIASGIRIMRVR